MEQTLPELQAQIDQLSQALRQWRETQDHMQPMEQRLSELTDRCAAILNRWVDTDERHAQAVTAVEARLSEWSAIENRLEQDAVQRSRDLESTIEREWQALRQMYAEPVKQLREQTATLGETCVAAANLALRGFERAETRFAALESDLQERLTQLSRDVQIAVLELRREGAARPPALSGDVAPFPLEGVMRIHDEVREASPATVDALPARYDVATPAVSASTLEPVIVHQLPEVTTSLADRMDTLEREVSTGQRVVKDTETRAARLRRDWRLALGVGGGVILLAAIFGLRLQMQVNARLEDAATQVAAAQRRAEAASDTATREIASTRADAERQIAAARDTAQRAQIVSGVLAAPDLVRFSLAGTDAAAGAYAQVLWSRTRGVVVSASRLPAAPEGSTYQAWLIGDGAAVSVGLVVPDTEGRVTLAVDSPQNLPRVVTGLAVTVEATGGSATPSRTIALGRPAQ